MRTDSNGDIQQSTKKRCIGISLIQPTVKIELGDGGIFPSGFQGATNRAGNHPSPTFDVVNVLLWKT